MTQTQIDLCLYLVLFLVVFLLIREVICWYFKINKRVELQEKILLQLEISNKQTNQKELD
jgi:hypothetical protein